MGCIFASEFHNRHHGPDEEFLPVHVRDNHKNDPHHKSKRELKMHVDAIEIAPNEEAKK